MPGPQTAIAVIEQSADGDRIAAIFQTVLTRRFWARVDRSAGPDACWPWIGGHARRSYGCFSRGRRGTHVRAHRFALELALGRPIQPGMSACHRCDNPPCVNPAHLFEGTQGDNLRDAAAKGRTGMQRHPELTRGDRNSQARLTTGQVIELRAAARSQAMSDVAVQFGVSLAHAYKIAGGSAWSHVPMEVSRV